MCGICGFIDQEFHDRYHPNQVMATMLETLVNRGPDDYGSYRQEGVNLGMRRLAVIDLSSGHQPIIDAKTGVVIVYNGEIYNYQNLRAELMQQGHRFVTQTDTEVVLKAYLQHKLDFSSKLNGMFAFAIWDPRSKQLILGRDRFGQKPLYYYQKNRTFIFASDLRTLLAHPVIAKDLNPQSLARYLQYRHVPGNETLINSVSQIPPGHLGVLKNNTPLALIRYWAAEYTADLSLDLEQATAQFEQLWSHSISKHLISDVPVGAFISGGIDSTLVVAEASKHTQQLKTFSIGFDDPAYDETQFAQQVADQFGCQHRTIIFNESLESLFGLWKKTFDQPFSDPALFPLMILSRESKPEVTVCLTGDGADELFAGYQRYQSLLRTRYLRLLPGFILKLAGWSVEAIANGLTVSSSRHRTLKAIGRRLRLVNHDISAEYLNQFYTFSTKQTATALRHADAIPTHTNAQLNSKEPLLSMLAYDLKHWLPDQMLVKSDRATMGFSLEARLPFLDNDLVDFALTLPPDLLLKKGSGKRVLRKACSKVVSSQLSQRPKQGFQIPIDQWLRNERPYITELIEDGLKRHADLFNATFIKSLLAAHLKNRQNHGERILTLALFFIWSKDL